MSIFLQRISIGHKYFLFFSALLLLQFSGTVAQTYQPLTLSGFNEDVIANGSQLANNTTTTSFDVFSTNPVNTFVFCAQDYTYGGTVTSYLPTGGYISALASITGVPYQLADYGPANGTSPNSLQLKSGGVTSGTLTISNTTPAQALYVLAATGSGSAGVTFTIHFQGGATQIVGPLTIQDWFNGANSVINASRVSLNAPTAIENYNGQGPNLYQYTLNINTVNQLASITSIDVSAAVSGEPRVNIMAVTALLPPCPVISVPGSVTACHDNGVTITAMSNLAGSTFNWYTSPTSATIGSGSSFTTPALTADTFYYVSAVYNGCESSRKLVKVNVNPSMPAPTVLPLDTAICSEDTIMLTATKDTLLDAVKIGDSTISFSLSPIAASNSSSASQMIFTQSELGLGNAARIITDISFYKTNAQGVSVGNAKIYMKWVSGSTVGTTAPDITDPANGYVQVYDGAWPNPATPGSSQTNPAEINITLNTPFDVQPGGTAQNLSIIIVRDNQPTGNGITSPKYQSGYTYNGTVLTQRCGYYNNNTGVTWSASGYPLTDTATRPNIKIGYKVMPPIRWSPVAGLYKDAGLATAMIATDTNTVVYTSTEGIYNVYSLWQGCTSDNATSEITYLPDALLSLTSASGTDTQSLCINTAITDITYSLSNATSAAIVWDNTPPGISGVYNAGVFTISGMPTAAGIYHYTIKPADGCGHDSVAGVLTVNPYAAVTLASAAGTDAQRLCMNTAITDITYNVSDATNATVTGLPAGVSGAYNAGVFTISGMPTAAGIYHYTVKPAGGCGTDSVTGMITVNPVPEITGTGSNPTSCGGSDGSITLSGLSSGATYTVAYTPGGSQMLTADAGGHISISGLSQGTYTNISVTTDSGCVSNAIATIILSDPNPPSAPVISTVSPVCEGSALDLNVSPIDPDPTASYSWVTPSGPVTGSSVSIGAASLSDAGTYTVTITVAGCSSSSSTAIDVNPLPVMDAVSGQALCAGSATTAINFSSTISSSSYSWTNDNTGIGLVGSGTGDIPSFTTTNTTNAPLTGNITVIPTANGCPGTASSFSITVSPVPEITGTGSNPTSCGGSDGSITLSGLSSGATYTVAYTPGGSQMLTADAGGHISISGLSQGTYTNISVTTDSGCVSNAIATIILSDPNPPSAPVISTVSPVCEGSALDLNVSPIDPDPTASYSWVTPSGPVTGSSVSIGAASLSDAGTYTVTITVAGCSSSSSTAIDVNPLPVMDAVSGQALCAGSATTAINFSSTISSSSYSWTNDNTGIGLVGSGTGDIPSFTTTNTTNAPLTGNITVIPTANGCPGTASSFSITVSPVPEITGTGSNPTSCGGSDGSITLSGLSSGATYTVAYTPGGSQMLTADAGGHISISGLSQGTYTNISVTTDSGCVSNAIATIILSDPNPPSAPVISTVSPVCEGSALDLNVSPIDPDPTASYSWVTPSGTVTGSSVNIGAASLSDAGTYTVTVTVAGCSNSSSTAISINSATPTPVVSGTDILCSGNSTPYTTTLTGGVWSSSNTAAATVDAATGNVTGTGNGTATITYTYTDGCGSTSGSHTITIGTATTTPTITGSTHVCPGSDITLSGDAGGGWWSSSNTGIATIGTTDGVVSGISPGDATITYGITGGCDTSYNTFAITVDTNITAGTITGLSELCAGGVTQLSNPAATPGGTWSSSNTATATVDASGLVTTATAGTATITYTVNTGCGAPAGADYAITVHPNTTNAVDTAICHGDTVHLGSQVLTQSGVYTGTFQTTYGCDSVVTLTLNVHPPATQDTLNLDSCGQVSYNGTVYTQNTSFTDTYPDQLGCDSLIKHVNITIGHEAFDTFKINICQGESYRFNGNDYSTTGRYSYSTPGANGCDSTITLDLKVNPLPVIRIHITAMPQHGFCIGDTTSLYATGAQAYTWENGYGKLLGTSDTVLNLLSDTGNVVKVTGVDTNGCSDTAGIVLAAEPCCTLLMPNAFSPNGDGRNDRFGPVTDGHPEGYQFQVFNRWGHRVFVSFRAEDQWDGTINGKPAPVATYYYYLTGKCANGESIKQKASLRS